MAKLTIAVLGLDLDPESFVVMDDVLEDSLLDGDLFLISPSMFGLQTAQTYQGLPSFGEDPSFRIKSCIGRLRGELLSASSSGKTIFVILVKPENAFVDSGRREHSGQGRNRVTTRFVDPICSYGIFPWNLPELLPSSGEQILLTSKSEILKEYWTDFGAASYYEAYFKGPLGTVLATTKTGSFPVACHAKFGAGNVVFLPPFNPDFLAKSLKVRASKGAPAAWQLRLREHLVSIDRKLRGAGEQFVEPDWARDDALVIPGEPELRAEIDSTRKAIETSRTKLSKLAEVRTTLAAYRHLLWAKGRLLEDAVLSAVRLFGFEAERLREDDSEFDVVMTGPEGRFLAEVEGKDSSAVAGDKINQLIRNLEEDFQRNDSREHAKGILFGNGQRTIAAALRGEPFTEKCVRSAQRHRIALVRTVDLFNAAREVLRNPAGEDFKRAVRSILLTTEGAIAVFPQVPRPSITEET